MSESRIRRLAPVVDMALEEERKAAAMLGQCQQQLDDASARLRDLVRAARLERRHAEGRGVWRGDQPLVERLDDGVKAHGGRASPRRPGRA